MEEILVYFSLKYEGDFEKIYRALKTKEKVDPILKEELFSKLKSKYVTVLSPDYPESLKYIDCPPFVLFYYGDISLCNKACIGVIGKRRPSEYGMSATKEIVKELTVHDFVVVSGMAIGIDGIAHKTSIENDGQTIAVLGSGIDYIYPRSHTNLYCEIQENHLVISEYPGLTPPRKTGFPKRNRIISGLSEKLLVIEANERSGTMITVGYALEQGKDIYAIPGRIHDAKGCLRLIQQGAKLVIDVDDILEDI